MAYPEEVTTGLPMRVKSSGYFILSGASDDRLALCAIRKAMLQCTEFNLARTLALSSYRKDNILLHGTRFW